MKRDVLAAHVVGEELSAFDARDLQVLAQQYGAVLVVRQPQHTLAALPRPFVVQKLKHRR